MEFDCKSNINAIGGKVCKLSIFSRSTNQQAIPKFKGEKSVIVYLSIVIYILSFRWERGPERGKTREGKVWEDINEIASSLSDCMPEGIVFL